MHFNIKIINIIFQGLKARTLFAFKYKTLKLYDEIF